MRVAGGARLGQNPMHRLVKLVANSIVTGLRASPPGSLRCCRPSSLLVPRLPLRHHGEEQERCEDYQVHDALKYRGSART